MRYSGTWLTPTDEALLEHLRAHGPASAEALSERADIEYSQDYISERCTRLAGQGGFVAFSHGEYHLTSKGEAYLDGSLDPEELPAAEQG